MRRLQYEIKEGNITKEAWEEIKKEYHRIKSNKQIGKKMPRKNKLK